MAKKIFYEAAQHFSIHGRGHSCPRSDSLRLRLTKRILKFEQVSAEINGSPSHDSGKTSNSLPSFPQHSS